MVEKIDRNLALEVTRVTEAAAMAVARLMGRNDLELIRQVAANAIRVAMRSVDVDGTIVIGEGRNQGEIPYLYVGEAVGNGTLPKMDVAVTPIDGLRLVSHGLPNAISLVAMAEEGSLYRNPAEVAYMNKIAVGPEVEGNISLDQSVEWNLKNIAYAKHIPVSEVTVIVLDRPSNQNIIREIRESGARLHLISGGDINGALMAALPNTGVDVLMGVGGTEQAIQTACILKCLGGEMEGRLYPRNIAERQRMIGLGRTLQEVYRVNDLVQGNNVFVSVTGVTGSERLEAVRYSEQGVHTHSLTMRSKSGTIRDVRSRHSLEKLMRYSEIEFLKPEEALTT
ncbi:MAG: class II fructose-bisphosphatase [Chloroflexi bacterium]|nr:class II fructose-bisphosphatase [Chloroflexota bacterium]